VWALGPSLILWERETFLPLPEKKGGSNLQPSECTNLSMTELNEHKIVFERPEDHSDT